MNNTLELILDLDPNAKKYSNYLFTICPNHESYPIRRSMQIHSDWFKCYSCNYQGLPERYLASLQSYSLVPRKIEYNEVRNPFTRWLRSDTLTDIFVKSYRTLQNNPSLMYYLKKRGLTEEVIKKEKFGYKEGFFLLPITDEKGFPIGGFARAGESYENVRYFVPDGQNPNLLFVPDWGKVKESNTMFLTFGSFDSISINQLGFASASTSAGQKIAPESLHPYRKKIVIVADKDEETAAVTLAHKLGWRGKSARLNYPEGCKDCNDILQKSPELLKTQLQAYI